MIPAGQADSAYAIGRSERDGRFATSNSERAMLSAIGLLIAFDGLVSHFK